MTFDEYCRAITTADVTFVLTHAPTHSWGLAHYALGDVTVQVGSDGGGSVAEGVTSSAVAIVIFPIAVAAAPILLDGNPVANDEYAILPPESHWVISSGGARRWVAISLPAAIAYRSFGLATWEGSRRRAMLGKHSGNDSMLLGQIVDELERLQPNELEDKRAKVIEKSMIEVCLSMMARVCLASAASDEPGAAQSAALVRDTLKYLRQFPDFAGRVVQLAAVMNVSERTMLRAFQRVTGTGPKRYLRLHRANLVRRCILDRRNPDLEITKLLVEFGITEFGRFAGEYKRLFGETPRQTLRTLRGNVAANGATNGIVALVQTLIIALIQVAGWTDNTSVI